MNLHQAPIVLGIATSLMPIFAAFLRKSSRLHRIATLLLGAAASCFLLALSRLLQIGPTDAPNGWVYALMGTAVPALLGGYLLSVVIGRDRPEEAFRNARRIFVLLACTGCASFFLLHAPTFVRGFDWKDGRGTIHLGSLGKAYLSYLLVGIVLIGYNLESTYRLVPSNVRHRLKLPLLGICAILGFSTFVLTTGVLYSSIGLGKLVASGMPIALANVLVGYGFLRGSLTDLAAPVSRRIVYSSFTAVAAGLYVLAVGIVAQVATFTDWSPDEVVTLSTGFLVVLLAVLLLLSNRFQRRVRRFIDQNFYVNRYDYRTQWSNVTQALESIVEKDSVLQCAQVILKDVFLADQVTIALREEATQVLRPQLGKGSQDPQTALPTGSPLALRLAQDRRSLLLDRRPNDFEYLPIYAENKAWLEATASQIVAPLFDGTDLAGCVGLERNDRDDPFSFEDAALLDSVAAHLSATLRSAQLAAELAESREMALISQWSNMLLHDLKNYLAPLRLVSQNLVLCKDNPDIADVAAQDIGRVADRMEALVRALSQLRDRPQLSHERIDLSQLVQSTLEQMNVERRDSLRVELDLDSRAAVLGDESMLRRVLENLVTNAIEAMQGTGTLTIRTAHQRVRNDGSRVQVSVTDTGAGIAEQFLRERLFRPFATTKKNGLGLGLYQCRSIVRAHGGDLQVESQPGKGTTFRIVMSAAGADPAAPAIELPRTPTGVTQ
jgi:putative PEP-CTERM system histidine kinase